MRRLPLFALLLFAFSAAGAEPRVDAVPFVHFYEIRTGFHLYTANPEEIAHMKTAAGWEDRGPVAYIYPKHVPGTVALFRVGKSEFGGENNLYTTNMTEANNAIETSGWREQGIAGYVSETQLPGTLPLYHFYRDCITPDDGKFRMPCEDAKGGDVHFYTTSESERQSALNGPFKQVNIAGYVWPGPVHAGGVPQIKVTPGVATSTASPPPPPTPEQHATAAALAAKGCKSFLGRVGDFLCSTQEGFDQCRRDKDRGSVSVCRPTAGLDASKPYQLKINVPPAKDAAEFPLQAEIVARNESTKTIGGHAHKYVDYTFRVLNAAKFPVDAFAPLTVLPPESCWNNAPSNRRLVLELAYGTGQSPNQKGLCMPLTSQGELASIGFSLAEERAIAKTARIAVRDRLTGVRHESGVIEIDAFGVDAALAQVGCKRFLGRANEFLCTSATGLAACQNLKAQGKPIVCRGQR
jgi:hypothetical protein